jgi:hypothetical protein
MLMNKERDEEAIASASQAVSNHAASPKTIWLFIKLEETPSGLALKEGKLRRSCALLCHRIQKSIAILDYFHCC